jgi:hypothetical protein
LIWRKGGSAAWFTGHAWFTPGLRRCTRQVFVSQNKVAQIYFSSATLKLFQALADSAFELLCFPADLRTWCGRALSHRVHAAGFPPASRPIRTCFP